MGSQIYSRGPQAYAHLTPPSGSSMSRHLPTHNISSKSMHAFLSNLANRQTDRQTLAKTFTSSFVGGKQVSAGPLLVTVRRLGGGLCSLSTV